MNLRDVIDRVTTRIGGRPMVKKILWGMVAAVLLVIGTAATTATVMNYQASARERLASQTTQQEQKEEKANTTPNEESQSEQEKNANPAPNLGGGETPVPTCPPCPSCPTMVPVVQPTTAPVEIPCTAFTEASYPERPGTTQGFKVQFGGGSDNRQLAHLWSKNAQTGAATLEDFILVPRGVAGVDFTGQNGYMGEVVNFPHTCDFKDLRVEAILGAIAKGPGHATGKVWMFDAWIRNQNGDTSAQPLISNAFQFQGMDASQIESSLGGTDPTQ